MNKLGALMVGGLIGGTTLLGYCEVQRDRQVQLGRDRQIQLLEQATENMPANESKNLIENYDDQIQHSLDSISFTDIFEGEQKAKVSKLMSKSALPISEHFSGSTVRSINTDALNKTCGDNLNYREMNTIASGELGFNTQFQLDSMLVRKECKTSKLLKAFEKTCKKISPLHIKKTLWSLI